MTVTEIKRILKPGDFMSIDRFDDGSQIFVVKEVKNNTVVFYGIDTTDSKDDVYTFTACVMADDARYVDDSFINVNGMLWKIAQKVKEGKFDEIQTSILKQ